MIQVRYFRQGRREPVAAYLEDLADRNALAAARVVDHIRALAAEGPVSPVLTCRHLGEGLWEMKVRSRMGHHRIFYCVERGVLWLLHAVTKKSAKTPRNALEVSYRRMKEVKGT